MDAREKCGRKGGTGDGARQQGDARRGGLGRCQRRSGCLVEGVMGSMVRLWACSSLQPVPASSQHPLPAPPPNVSFILYLRSSPCRKEVRKSAEELLARWTKLSGGATKTTAASVPSGAGISVKPKPTPPRPAAPVSVVALAAGGPPPPAQSQAQLAIAAQLQAAQVWRGMCGSGSVDGEVWRGVCGSDLVRPSLPHTCDISCATCLMRRRWPSRQ